MIHVLVIDAEDNCRLIKMAVESIYEKNSIDIAVDFNKSREDSWKQIFDNPYRYDAVMIDIGFTGDELAEVLGKAGNLQKVNRMVQIIFITDMSFVPRAVWQVPHIYIMRKPAAYDDIRLAMERMNVVLKEKLKYFSAKIIVKYGKIMRIVPQYSIIYAKKARNGITLVTEQGEIYHHESIDQFIKNMSSIFCRCHSSYIVNFRHVTCINKEYMALDNGENIAISRSYRKNVKDFVNNLSLTASERWIN